MWSVEDEVCGVWRGEVCGVWRGEVCGVWRGEGVECGGGCGGVRSVEDEV